MAKTLSLRTSDHHCQDQVKVISANQPASLLALWACVLQHAWVIWQESWLLTKSCARTCAHAHAQAYRLTIQRRTFKGMVPRATCIQPCQESSAFSPVLMTKKIPTHRPVPTNTPPTSCWVSGDMYLLLTHTHTHTHTIRMTSYTCTQQLTVANWWL